jgi:hypothetical protein
MTLKEYVDQGNWGLVLLKSIRTGETYPAVVSDESTVVYLDDAVQINPMDYDEFLVSEFESYTITGKRKPFRDNKSYNYKFTKEG